VTRVSLKVWLFLGVLALGQLFIGYHLGGRPGLFLGFLASVSLNLLVFFFSTPQLLQKFNARRMEGQDSWGLNTLLQKYAEKTGVIAPTLYIWEHPSAIAFSLGRPGHRAAIALSSGLLQNLTKDEIEAVLVHQICHLRVMDRFRIGVASTLASALVGLSQVLDTSWPLNWVRKSPLQNPFHHLLCPLAWLMIRLTMADRSFFEVDDLAASLLRDRKALATALWKMDSYCQTLPLDPLPCTHYLFAVNPEGLRDSNWFFISHPKIENRLRRLVGTYPL